MGCLKSRFASNNNKEKYVQPEEPELTDTQIEILEKSWESLKHDIAKVGVITFMNLFQTHPEVQDAFLPFQQLSKEDMEHSAILRSHALRVMGTVEKCIGRIKTPEKLHNLMHELGERHTHYNARYDFVDLVGNQFVIAIKPHFGDRWTQEMESAWVQLFKVMTFHMKRGLIDAPVVTY
ncbi:neuroglobin-1-like [Saccostrea cucullata]|uniref:neuroglobin-1-like n=1 Tax=Saccostrea cuccullata TaxID=36930 RepID=UPI002ED09F6A